jgi:hypothetical protein
MAALRQSFRHGRCLELAGCRPVPMLRSPLVASRSVLTSVTVSCRRSMVVLFALMAHGSYGNGALIIDLEKRYVT